MTGYRVRGNPGKPVQQGPDQKPEQQGQQKESNQQDGEQDRLERQIENQRGSPLAPAQKADDRVNEESPAEKPQRLFIGIRPDSATQHYLEGLVGHARRLLPPGRDRTRWTSPSNRHLTLAFLGETPASQVPALERGLLDIAATAAPCSGRIVSLGPFPKPRSRLLAAELLSNPELDRLHSGCRELMRALGMKPESAAFRPHFTLGRSRQGFGRFPPQQLDFVARLDNLVLFRSDMAPGGSQYTPLFEVELETAADDRDTESGNASLR